MALLSNLLSKAKSVASSFATGVDKAFGAVKTAVKDTLAAPAANTAGLINSIKSANAPKTTNAATISTMQPNMSTVLGPAAGQVGGKTTVLTSTGQADTNKTAALNSLTQNTQRATNIAASNGTSQNPYIIKYRLTVIIKMSLVQITLT